MITQQDIDNIEIRHVVVLDTDAAGDLYMEKMYPIWCDVIVVTVEGKYPQNPMLRKRVIEELATNKNIYCMLYGVKANKELSIASEKQLFLADFFIRDLQLGMNGHGIFDLDEFRIIEFCMAFCNIMYDRSRVQDFNSTMDNFDPRLIKEFHQLIRS